jgi:hypothetical protein
MRVVTPFRPFPAESVEHQELGPFDWIGTMRIMMASVTQSCRCDVVAITDIDTDLPVRALHYETTHRRLMLWILEVSLRYLESPSFVVDTVMVSPDMLVYQDLRPWFRGADLGILVRSDQRFVEAGRPILNSVQWWSVAGKPRLIEFYRQTLALAQTLPEDVITWGADSEPIRQLLEPLDIGIAERAGLTVEMIEAGKVLEAFSETHRNSKPGKPKRPRRAVMDFRYLRKRDLADYAAKTGIIV